MRIIRPHVKLISFSKHRLTDGNIIDEYILRLMLEQGQFT